jgi:hypothetical protein
MHTPSSCNAAKDVFSAILAQSILKHMAVKIIIMLVTVKSVISITQTYSHNVVRL